LNSSINLSRRIQGYLAKPDGATPAAECTDKIASWANDGPPIELVVYPGAYHGFYYPHLQPGTILFGHWVEYNAAAADNANHRLHQFLDRHLRRHADSGNRN
jgi:dienelactone hydrolase